MNWFLGLVTAVTEMKWFPGFFTAFLGTAIGAFAGAWAITKLQDSKNKEPRKILLRAINGFEGYKTYFDAAKEFNKLSLVEKKAILVALKNLSIPIKLKLINDRFDLEEVLFEKDEIKSDDLSRMRKYIKDGLCDKLFFNEIDSSFHQAPPKTVRAREYAIKILDAMRHHDLTITAGKLAKVAGLSFNQFEVVYVFWKTLNVATNESSEQGKYECDETKINEAIKDVNDGIFDHLYYWDHRAFENMNSQRLMADNLNSNVFVK